MQDRKKSKKESTREPAVLRRQEKNLKTLKDKLKQSEETFKKCKELHNLLLETIPHGIQECDASGTITYCNTSFCLIVGYDMDEVAGKKIWDFFDSESEQRGLEAYFLKIAREKPPPTHYISKIRTKDGRPVIIQVDWNYKYDADGKLAGFVSVITDITKRRQTEENLLKEITLSQALINSLPGFFYLIDFNGRLIRWNRNLEEFYGYSAEELTRLNVMNLVADKDKELAMIRMQEVLTKGQSSAEVEVISKEGKTIPFLFTGVCIDIDDKPYLAGVGIDISRLKEVEETLEVRAYQQAVLSKLGQRALADMDLPMLMDKSVNITVKTLGVEYCKILELLPDGNSLILRAGVGWKEGLIGHATIGAGTDSQAGYTLLSDEPVIVKDLRTETRFSGPPLLHNHGIISGMSVIIGDINRPYGILGAHTGKQRTFTQDDVNFLQNIANILAAAIDRKQAENEIRKMQKLESIGVLAGGIAHDFNNLLTVILGNISLLKMHISKEHKIYDRLTDAENACIKAKELSYRLLTFSKGGEPLKGETLISNILKRTVTLTLGYSSASYEFIIPDDLCPVKIDEGQIEQVLRNIVTNAREAIPDGGTIRVYAENISVSKENRLPLKEGNYVRISIEDSGCGISEENLPKLFDPYFTTKDVGSEKGQGLGLSICYSIIKAHGGLLSVESRTGLGTTVHIYLSAF